MTGIDYIGLKPVPIGKQKTITVAVEDKDGKPLNLDGLSLLAEAKPGTGAVIGPTFEKISPQAGKNIGRAQCVITAQQTTDGDVATWEVRLFVGASSGSEEFLWDAAFKFDAVAALS